MRPPAIVSIFVAQVYGIHLGTDDYLLIAFASVIGSAATASLTGAIVMLTLTLSTLGLPWRAFGLLPAIDPILDMMRTATNVAGQVVTMLILAARAGILVRFAYDRAGADLMRRHPLRARCLLPELRGSRGRPIDVCSECLMEEAVGDSVLSGEASVLGRVSDLGEAARSELCWGFDSWHFVR
ncbi:dicarboxylate/amino acid:cation symporter [Kitasatospora acidiphila]|uniref:Dicarboxylate/amino acid:cation symporter n=1 Tax=Kitasatospora acidiphila TaxID=2567942 RepID=A0A540W906_9ACTN|nr:dicarboxylate/amino acid:cation symporter [Kitasatospora acidiphila]